MKAQYQLSKLAQLDLENIWEYSCKNWSIKQADKYVKQVISQIEKLFKNTEIGKSIINIKPNHRMKKVNSHLVIFKVENQILKVDRILYERMDIKNQL